MSRLIAAVATAVILNGQRTVIPAGQELPDELSEHDKRELTGSGAARDQTADERAADQVRREAEAGQAEFQQARERQLQARASLSAEDKGNDLEVKPAETPPATPAPTTAPTPAPVEPATAKGRK